MRYGTSLRPEPISDVKALADRAQSLEKAGFDYLTNAGHLLTAPAGRYPERPESQYALAYHDPFVLFAYLAALTSRIHFIPSIVILPLRETAAVARQSAELAFLSNGRFELGVGLSWQEAEYRAVGQDLRRRGARLAEQVEVLRLFWTQPYVTFKGKFHDIDNLGLGRLPDRPIPIWFGTTFNEGSMRRAASAADGWMPIADPTAALANFKDYVSQSGREFSALRLMGRLTAGDEGKDAWIAEAKRLQSLGMTHITIDPAPGLDLDAGTERVMAVLAALEGV